MAKAITTHIQGIKCDNKDCDYQDMSVSYEDYPKWINKPCPKCGANLLTVHDYKVCQTVMALSKLFGNIEVPEEKIDTQMNITLDGTDKIDFDVRKSTGESLMEKYRCIKDFSIPKYDENECPTEEYLTVRKGAVYEHTEGYVSQSDIRLYLEDGDDDCGYLDITYKTLEEYFEKIQ